MTYIKTYCIIARILWAIIIAIKEKEFRIYHNNISLNKKYSRPYWLYAVIYAFLQPLLLPCLIYNIIKKTIKNEKI